MTTLLAPAGILGSVFSFVFGGPVKAAAGVALSAIDSWIVAGAEAMLKEVIAVISLVTTPSLSASWFSATYWQVAALAMLLTVPFLFAAAVQAILRSDLQLLLRAALFDLPIATLAVYAAAPLITLMLAATDEMCSLISGGGAVGGSFLAGLPGDLSRAGSGFLIVVIAVVILMAGMVLLVELVVRSAAIYVVVLFLPLGFAAMVWPARRIWIKRMLETLVALILSKFAMVAILTLAVSALASLSQHPTALTTALTAMALIVISTASPWALLRLLPFTELAASAGTMLHSDTRQGSADTRDLKHKATDVALGAGADPLAAGLAGLRDFVTGGASAESGDRRGFRRAAMAVVGSGDGDGADAGAGGPRPELPPGPPDVPGGPGAGPEPSPVRPGSGPGGVGPEAAGHGPSAGIGSVSALARRDGTEGQMALGTDVGLAPSAGLGVAGTSRPAAPPPSLTSAEEPDPHRPPYEAEAPNFRTSAEFDLSDPARLGSVPIDPSEDDEPA